MKTIIHVKQHRIGASANRAAHAFPAITVKAAVPAAPGSGWKTQADVVIKD